MEARSKALDRTENRSYFKYCNTDDHNEWSGYLYLGQFVPASFPQQQTHDLSELPILSMTYASNR